LGPRSTEDGDRADAKAGAQKGKLDAKAGIALVDVMGIPLPHAVQTSLF
jgi:hypothetical protein